MDDLTARLQVNLNPVARTDRALGSVPYSIPIVENLAYIFGTLDLQLNVLFDESLSMPPADIETFDLNGGGLTNYNGEAVSFGHVKVIYLRNHSLVDSITMAPAPAAGWANFGAGRIIPPNSFEVFGSSGAGIVVPPGADTFRLTNGPTGPTQYDLVILGTNP